jgi:hypothetical protein
LHASKGGKKSKMGIFCHKFLDFEEQNSSTFQGKTILKENFATF